MKRDRESIYLHLNREIGRILEGRISAVVNTDLDGVLWKLADELADKPTAQVEMPKSDVSFKDGILSGGSNQNPVAS